MSSDWISHGLMDSMVDSFVPLLRKIDREVEGVDSLITNIKGTFEAPPPSDVTIVAGASDATELEIDELKEDEKTSPASSIPPLASRVEFRLPPRLHSWKTRFRSRLWHLLPKRMRRYPREKAVVPKPPTRLATFQTLLRMANTRRLVTSLGRLLATKSEVIGQLRKRLRGAGADAVDWDEGDMAGGQEVGIYLGDVQGAC